MSDPNHVQRANALALVRCAQCDYALEGLPSAGKCPECGWEFLSGDVVLYGWSREGSGQMRLKDYFLFLCLLIGILVARYVATPLQDRALAIRVIIAGGPLVLIMFAWFSYRTRRARGENPGPWQLRFGPRGCFGPGKVELTPRTKITKVEAQSIDGQSWAFRIVRRTQALSWRFQRCEVDVEASSTIVVAAGETDIRLLMQRLGEWIGDNVVWINSPGGKQSASVRRNEGVK